MSVPVPEGPALGDSGLLDLAGRFHDQHASDRGFSFPNQQPLLRGVRLIASGSTPKPDALARTGAIVDASAARKHNRAVYFGTDFIDSPVYDGNALGPGATIEGPAIIEELFTVVVLAPGNVARLDRHGNYDISL
jgi:N-methylhydantoinase A